MSGNVNTTGQTQNQNVNQATNQSTTGATNQSQNTNQAQTSTSALTPYDQSAAGLSGILSNLNTVNPNLTPDQQAAISQLNAQGAAGNQFLPGITKTTNQLLSGGGAMNQAPMINNAYNAYTQQLAPYTSASYLNPYSTPGFSNALATTNADITNQINSQFAAAGRDMSGMNTQDLARGLSQGEGQLVSNQYNQNVAQQQAAMGALYGAGNTTAGNLTGLQQTGLGNQQAGITASNAATAAQQYGPNLQLQAGMYGTQIPLSNLQAQSGILYPAASTFGTQTGSGTGTSTGNMTGTTSGTNVGTTTGQMTGVTQNTSPLWQQIAGGVLGVGSMLGGNNGLLNVGTPKK